MRRWIELVAVLDFCLHLLKCLTIDDGGMVVGYVVARQLPSVLDDSVLPWIFRNVALQKDIPSVDHVSQDISDEVHDEGRNY